MRHDRLPDVRRGSMSLILAAAVVGACPACGPSAQRPGEPVEIRAGLFPNITHAQALVGRAQGRFEAALEGKAVVSWRLFNAGPSAIEALFAGEIDLTYIGPNPAITGYVRSQGQALRVVSGACSGGAALVVRGDAGIASPADFAGRSLATPQLGNTQDVAARHWLTANGLDWLERGGTVRVLPLANPDQLTLFLKKELDAAWTVEPWVSRLEQEAGGRVFLEESSLWPEGKYVTTHLIAATAFLEKHPDLVRAWLAEHAALTVWIRANQDAAMGLLNEEIRRDTGAALPEAILRSSFGRLELTDDPLRPTLLTSAERAFDLGFLGKRKPDLSGMHDLRLLNEVRAAAGEPPIP
jgi:NitT/TauT family transport system substrate-binding protein